MFCKDPNYIPLLFLVISTRDPFFFFFFFFFSFFSSHFLHVHIFSTDNSRLCSSSSHTKNLDAYEDSERSTVTDDGDSMKVEEQAKNLEVAKQGIVERTIQKEGNDL